MTFGALRASEDLSGDFYTGLERPFYAILKPNGEAPGILRFCPKNVPVMESLDKLAEWLKASDSLGGLFNEETDSLKAASRQALAELEEAVQAATAQQVAEDEIAFLEAIEPVRAGLSRLSTSLTQWENLLQRLEPRG